MILLFLRVRIVALVPPNAILLTLRKTLFLLPLTTLNVFAGTMRCQPGYKSGSTR